MPKLKEQIEIEKSIIRSHKRRAKSSSVIQAYDEGLQSLQRIDDVCKERNRY